jgi:asparagine synthase (glutamine-hydrolysing)
MCGIFAILQPDSRIDGDTIDRALASLRHRGPDDRGTWRDEQAGVILGQTRLSIQDVSEAGHQPMVSASGRFVLAFNGEIYNHRDLRARLDAACPEGSTGMSWRGHSDTETLLACIENWGLDEAIAQASGMFAIALWDRELRQLSLVRDRVGEKPLYYGRVGGCFAVASEVRAFTVMAGRPPDVDRRSVGLLMRFGAIPAPYSIFEGISKLEPGNRLSIGIGQVREDDLPAPRPYWRATDLAHDCALRQQAFASDAQAVDALHSCLAAAVRRQLISDVPLGAFLSGGIDSSLVVALMQAEARKASAEPVRTFSIGFHERGYDEAQHAKRVAAHLQTNHTELYVSQADCLAMVPQLARIYDEPFADSSQIGVSLVSRLAAEHVTVALTGDGGDEVFGGYNRYTRAASLWRRMEQLPPGLRGRVAAACMSAPGRALAGSIDRLGGRLPGGLRPPRLADRVEKISRMLASNDARDMYLGMVEYWEPDELMLHPVEASGLVDSDWPGLPTLEEQMMLLDLCFVLPTDMLTKVDRAAMAVGLETRLPFLDPAVMEFAWKLPIRYKIRDGQGKWLVQKLLHRFVPKSLVDRPKMGFESPVTRWLRGPLRDWAESLLDEGDLDAQGYFRVAEVRRAWASHLAGREDNASKLWAVLSFQAWLAEQRGAADVRA